MPFRLTFVAASVAVTFAIAAARVGTPAPFYVNPGDTVVFYGDSITDQRLYTMLTEFFIVTRYPKLNARFVHSGWGGDRVTGGGGGPIDVRLDRDVVAYHPNVMTIMLGMNDGSYTNHKPADDETYFAGYKHLVETVRHDLPNLRLTLLGPSPYDDVTRPVNLQPVGYNAVLLKYGDWLRTYAAETKSDFADLNTGVTAMLRQAETTDAATAAKIIPDRVHPGLAGHLIMAEQLLKAWHARPVVSAVTIDVAKGKITQADFTHITNFHATAPFVWTETDDALPLPFEKMLEADKDHSLALAISSSDVTAALNRQPLRIVGLPPGKYQVAVDGDSVGLFSDVELEHGFNLAVLDTPMARQAMDVRGLTERHLDIHQQRWRTFQLPLENLDLEHLDATLKALDNLEADVIARQHLAAQPRPHVFQVTPAP